MLERRGNQILFHPRLLELSGYYHFAPRPCQVRSGNQKGRVERAIRYVRDSFWAGRTFTTLAECNRQALQWRDQVAHRRRWPGGDHLTVAEAFAEEQLRLLAPALHPFSTDRVETVRSHKTIYVRFDLNDYSIPPEAVGKQLTLVASDTIVRILDGSIELARHTCSIPPIRTPYSKPNARPSTRRPADVWSKWRRKAGRFSTWPSHRANRPARRHLSC